MNDVRTRFLKSILAQIPAERIAELHFFTPIRQGQIETGVAVLAAEPERPLPVAEVAAAAAESVTTAVTESTEETIGAGEFADGADAERSADEATEEAGADESAEATEEAGADESAEATAEAAAEAEDDDSPYADSPAPSAIAGEPAVADVPSVPSVPSVVSALPPTPRFEIITAAYRWTRKGPERGKWEVDVTTEADAPLPTVGTVVLGVHQRAGEELEPLRLTNAELQQLLSEPTWQTTP